MAGGKSTLLHIIFQRHHIAPDDFMAKPSGVKAFMLSSMKIQLEAERKSRGGEDYGSDSEG